MHARTTSRATLTIGAFLLALTSCASDDESADRSQSEASSPISEDTTPSDEPRIPGSPSEQEAESASNDDSPTEDSGDEYGAWADELVTAWLNGKGVPDFDTLHANYADVPQGHVIDYYAPEEGHLTLTLEGDGWTSGGDTVEGRELDAAANDFMILVGPEHPELEVVTAETQSGEHSASDHRSENIQVD